MPAFFAKIFVPFSKEIENRKWTHLIGQIAFPVDHVQLRVANIVAHHDKLLTQ